MVALIEVSEQSNEEEETLTAGKSCRRALTVLEQKGTWHYSTQIIQVHAVFTPPEVKIGVKLARFHASIQGS